MSQSVRVGGLCVSFGAREALIDVGFRVEARHQREDADGKQQRRREHAEETQPWPEAENKAASGDRPQDKCGGLVQVVHRAVLERKAAFGHGDGV